MKNICKIEVDRLGGRKGYLNPDFDEGLLKVVNEVSKDFFNKDILTIGVGASIPFMGILKDKYPKSNFMITGCVHPENNLHSADENFNIAYGAKLFKTLGKILVKVGEGEWKKPEPTP